MSCVTPNISNEGRIEISKMEDKLQSTPGRSPSGQFSKNTMISHRPKNFVESDMCKACSILRMHGRIGYMPRPGKTPLDELELLRMGMVTALGTRKQQSKTPCISSADQVPLDEVELRRMGLVDSKGSRLTCTCAHFPKHPSLGRNVDFRMMRRRKRKSWHDKGLLDEVALRQKGLVTLDDKGRRQPCRNSFDNAMDGLGRSNEKTHVVVDEMDLPASKREAYPRKAHFRKIPEKTKRISHSSSSDGNEKGPFDELDLYRMGLTTVDGKGMRHRLRTVDGKKPLDQLEHPRLTVKHSNEMQQPSTGGTSRIPASKRELFPKEVVFRKKPEITQTSRSLCDYNKGPFDEVLLYQKGLVTVDDKGMRQPCRSNEKPLLHNAVDELEHSLDRTPFFEDEQDIPASKREVFPRSMRLRKIPEKEKVVSQRYSSDDDGGPFDELDIHRMRHVSEDGKRIRQSCGTVNKASLAFKEALDEQEHLQMRTENSKKIQQPCSRTGLTSSVPISTAKREVLSKKRLFSKIPEKAKSTTPRCSSDDDGGPFDEVDLYRLGLVTVDEKGMKQTGRAVRKASIDKVVVVDELELQARGTETSKDSQASKPSKKTSDQGEG